MVIIAKETKKGLALLMGWWWVGVVSVFRRSRKQGILGRGAVYNICMQE